MDARFHVGDRVRNRGERWRITEVVRYDDCALLTLAGIQASNTGLERRVLTPFDRIASFGSSGRLRIVRAPEWRRVCRSLIAEDGGAGALRTARWARIDLLPHQLEPALAIVRGLGTRVLIADEVGLGKTIEAGLIVAELKARGAIERVLVLTPAGLRDQWVEELADRFRLPLAVADMKHVGRRRARLPIGVNPWSAEQAVVASIDYVKRPEVLPAVQACRWDVVIVDEAHGVATGHDRHHAVASLCGAAPYVLLLTATPHNGDAQAFASLCGIGDHGDTLLLFRRTRNEVGGERERRVHQLLMRPGAAETRMHAQLALLTRMVCAEHGRLTEDVWLTLITLHKRALSSAYALERSVRRRLALLIPGPDARERQPPLPFDDPDGEFEGADMFPVWAGPVLRTPAEERRILAALADAAHEAAAEETKLAALQRLLRRLREPAVVFTEYRDTLLHVRDAIAPEALVVHGGLTREERRAALEQFSIGRAPVLLATDAAGEGLNLHRACRVVINLELPWNPMRLEQRIGRVDRIGQQRRVHAFHLIAAHTSEMQILARLHMRVARARQDIGASDPLGTPPAWTEQDMARWLFIGPGGNAAPERGPVGHEAGLARPMMVALRTDAVEEHSRLVMARRFKGGEDTSSPSAEHAPGPLVTLSRRCGVRAALGLRVLVVLRSVLTDDTGRLVASRLVPMLVHPVEQPTRVRAIEWMARLLSAIDGSPLGVNQDGLSPWLQTSRAAHNALWEARLNRERAIGNHAEARRRTQRQPGLFSAWAEQQILAADRRAPEAEASARAIAACEQARHLNFHAATPVLILIP